MEILRQAQERAIYRVVEALRAGEVVVVPTDTVYGLIADATSEEAVAKIFDIKGRPREKAVSLFVRDIKMAKEYAEALPKQERFLRHVLPRKVTAILRLKTPAFSASWRIRTGRQDEGLRNGKTLAHLVVRDGTIGMRAPKDEFLQKILKEISVPLAQTSANISGKPPARNVEEILLCFNAVEHQPDLVIDGGVRGGESSTVVDLSGKEPRVLREGTVSREMVFQWYTYFNG